MKTNELVEKLRKLKTYNLALADAMIEIMRRGELGHYVCLEDVIEIINNEVIQNE